MITLEIAEKVRDTVDAGLSEGVGNPIPGQMCVEAAVCYALGLPHGDDPGCVSPALRSLKIALNDKNWSSSLARAKGLRRLALVQLGSVGVFDDTEFMRRVSEMTIRRMVPMALRAAARRVPAHAIKLEAAAIRCEQEGTRESARAAALAAAASTRDRVLADFAELVVQILIDMKAPGCQWLALVPLTDEERTV